MSGYAFLATPCVLCGQLVTCNPHLVPSLRVNRGTGQLDPEAPRQALCETCVRRLNAKREAAGLPPFNIPPGAYDAVAEEEL